jgi:ParB-like chromosome segregation protein Spo0J
MRETREENRVSRIALDKLVAHPDNPNRMSKTSFAKLVRNIERTGRYEPLIVRPCPQKNCHSCETCPEQGRRSRNPGDNRKTCFQIINGHHRWQALRELVYETAEAIVWDIDDQHADILLATLNRLGGSDVLEKKLALLKRLSQRMEARKLAKLLPQTARQIERLTSILDARFSIPDELRVSRIKYRALVFFVNDKQQKIIENALSAALTSANSVEAGKIEEQGTKAAKNAAVLTYIARQFLTSSIKNDPHCCVKENHEITIDN